MSPVPSRALRCLAVLAVGAVASLTATSGAYAAPSATSEPTATTGPIVIPFPTMLATQKCGPKNDTVVTDPEWLAKWGDIVAGPWIDTKYKKTAEGQDFVDGSAQIKEGLRGKYIWEGSEKTNPSDWSRWMMSSGNKTFRHVDAGPCEVPFPTMVVTEVCGPDNDTAVTDPEWLKRWGAVIKGPWIDANYKTVDGVRLIDGSAQITEAERDNYIWEGSGTTAASDFTRWQMYPGNKTFRHVDTAERCPADSLKVNPVSSVASGAAVTVTGSVAPATAAGGPVELYGRTTPNGKEVLLGKGTTAADATFSLSGTQSGTGVYEVQVRAEGKSSDWIWYARSAGSLGAPTADKNCNLTDKGCFQTFAGGSIYSSAHTDPHWIRRAIRDRWGTTGWENGKLGYPTSDEICGLKNNGCVQRFTGGLMYWSPATGTQPVLGAIGDAYAGVRWENSALGYPTGAEFCGLRDGGCAQRFSGGLIYWSPATGAHVVLGAILDRYAAMGWETSALGYPTSNEFCGLRDGGCFQTFSGGSIYFSPRSGAWPSWGALRDHWGRNGWENGRYGYPTGMERCSTVQGVAECKQGYQGGAITWNARRGTF